ncbi:MAG TPA: (2Fe-2S)-binding protein [Burkholderiaceae bacterium]|jgi:isoquinoline 1-oxidoreductase alpha subunit|nr:(2Fe-2S)-binding protein [Burkholderiaceae bacterium]
MIKLKVNGTPRNIDVPPDVPLLWVLREELQLTGTKFGCGVAACGACTVHLDGDAVRSCVYPVSAAAGRSVTTIEGLSRDGTQALQRAWIAQQVPQCGYCQSGMLMSAAALLQRHPRPTDQQIDEAMTNICRCGTYPRVKAAIKQAAGVA